MEAPVLPEGAGEGEGGRPPVILSPQQFRLWRLHCEGKSHTEIAEALGLKYGAVVQALCVARRNIKAAMGTEAKEGGEMGEQDLKAVPVACRKAR